MPYILHAGYILCGGCFHTDSARAGDAADKSDKCTAAFRLGGRGSCRALLVFLSISHKAVTSR